MIKLFKKIKRYIMYLLIKRKLIKQGFENLQACIIAKQITEINNP